MRHTWSDSYATPPAQKHAQWAENIKAMLAAGRTLSLNDVAWLYSATGCTPYTSSAESMCDELINKWALMQITARLKK